MGVKENRISVEAMRGCLSKAVHLTFSPDPDFVNKKNEPNIRAIVRTYATSEAGIDYQPTVSRYWLTLKKAAHEKANFAGATDVPPTKEIYLECLEEMPLSKKLGNQDFYWDSSFTSNEMDVIAATAGRFGKFGFPLGHAETADLAQRIKREQLKEDVKNNKIEGFVDLPENKWDEHGNQGDIPICGTGWFLG